MSTGATPTFSLSTYALLTHPAGPTSISGATRPTAHKEVPMPPPAVIIPYQHNSVLLQIIRIKYSLNRQEKTLEQWRAIMAPHFLMKACTLWQKAWTQYGSFLAKASLGSGTIGARLDKLLKAISSSDTKLDEAVQKVSRPYSR